MKNIPGVRMGIVAVSRDCFPFELSRRRRARVVGAAKARKIPLTEIKTVVEKETDVVAALAEIKDKNVNALVVFLGNFGPEGPSTLLAQRFDGPAMFVAAAEETARDLVSGRGDAFCGLLSASYNLGLRGLNPHIPEYPVGTAEEVAGMIGDFAPVARVILGMRKLKVFSFGPRPQDFLACNAPIKPLYDLGIEVMENSELDLYDLFLAARGDRRVKAVAREMARELGPGLAYPDLLEKLAQFEVALMNFFEANLGASGFGVFANKCWPAFEKYFGFVPCYVNSRLAARGIPVACEVDIYGAVSEYILACATGLPVTLLDVNNTVPEDMVRAAKGKARGYRPTDLFMGFHCGNTPSACLVDGALKYQLIMHRLMEAGKEPDITRGTLEGRIRPGAVTIFRLQSTAGTALCAYMAEG
ncbi:MAG: fucose isomerase, partial [Candidatus Aminicenantes bacterium]|nr:fucose isomerase [Candidatus Aminicenantes bacterium]